MRPFTPEETKLISEYKLEFSYLQSEMLIVVNAIKKKHGANLTRDALEADLKAHLEKCQSPRRLSGNKLFQARRELKLTQVQLAKMLGYLATNNSASYISKLETGAKPLPKYITLLIRAYLSGYRPRNWPKGK